MSKQLLGIIVTRTNILPSASVNTVRKFALFPNVVDNANLRTTSNINLRTVACFLDLRCYQLSWIDATLRCCAMTIAWW